MQRMIRKTNNRRPKAPSTTPPPPAQALPAVMPSAIDDADLPEN
jgi:hypothetical protein